MGNACSCMSAQPVAIKAVADGHGKESRPELEHSLGSSYSDERAGGGKYTTESEALAARVAFEQMATEKEQRINMLPGARVVGQDGSLMDWPAAQSSVDAASSHTHSRAPSRAPSHAALGGLASDSSFGENPLYARDNVPRAAVVSMPPSVAEAVTSHGGSPFAAADSPFAAADSPFDHAESPAFESAAVDSAMLPGGFKAHSPSGVADGAADTSGLLSCRDPSLLESPFADSTPLHPSQHPDLDDAKGSQASCLLYTSPSPRD